VRRFLVILFLSANSLCYGQLKDRISGRFEDAPLVDLLKLIEQQTAYKFFYIDSWVDTVLISASFDNVPFPEVLTNALSSTLISYYILDSKVILTYNVHILDKADPAIFSQSTFNEDKGVNYSFQREYSEPAQALSGKNDAVYEIGKKTMLVTKTKYAVTGYVREKNTNEPIPGALVYLENENNSAVTNAYGFYSINASQGLHTIVFQHTGKKALRKRVIIHSDGKFDALMEDDIISLKEVVIESNRDVNISSVQMGVTSLDVKNMKNVPKILGENDVIKLALTLPGVKSIGEGASGINVRGGSTGQNLIMMNEATVYNSSHFLGFFSVFNSDALKSSELYKSGIPVQYGGRLSSILDIQMKDGNQKKISGQGGIGPITSRLTLEIPLKKERMSVMVGGRTTYSNWILKKLPESSLKNSAASFYDFFGRFTYKYNDKNSFYVSAYYSNDRFKLSSDSLFSYNNRLASFQWRHTFSGKLNALLSVTRSEYKYEIDFNRRVDEAFKFGFDISESNVKLDFNYFEDIHKVDIGFQSRLYDVSPGYFRKGSSQSAVIEKFIENEKALENALYIADQIDLLPKLSLYVGLRYTYYALLGPQTLYEYNGRVKNKTTVTDTLTYASNKIVKTYSGPEYRASIRYKLNEDASLKASYNRTRQYIHMISNTISVSPTDTWKLSDPNVSPQIADQVSIGFYKDLKNNLWQTSFEVYYKQLQNIIDYKIGAKLLLNEHLERDILQGKGKAYGFEFLLKKQAGKFNGWISYTYSRTFIQLDSEFESERVNNGKYFPANYDKPHDVYLVSNYRITRRYSISLNFNYSTGRPITYPVGVYKLGSAYRIDYSDRNQYRIPDYIRADVGFNIEGNHRLKKIAHSFWSISIYNLLGRKNPYSVFFVAKDGEVKGYKLSIFGAPIPSITYNFKF
jgi:hypothetical protein